MLFTKDPTFQELLKTKHKDIQQRRADGVQETSQFQRMRALLNSCRKKFKEGDFRLVIISKSELSRLVEDAYICAEQLFTTHEFISNRIVKVNSSLQIIESNNEPLPISNNDARRFYTAISKDSDLVCFLIDPDSTINYFIDGKEYGEGVFYSDQSRKAYEELKTIDKLEEVLNEYRTVLTNQDTYIKFFAPKSQLKSLRRLIGSTSTEKQFIQDHKHLLRNKPEECFREDIRNYIKQHMKVIVGREVVLDNLDKLDIQLFDEEGTDLYFIEIKWVGDSINANGDNIGTTFDANRINPQAVIQVVKYIDQLLKEKQNIKMGYLMVFDARKDDMSDTGVGITEHSVPEDLRPHFHRYKKLQDFRVINTNPR